MGARVSVPARFDDSHLNWVGQVLCQAPVQPLSHFLDCKDFTALEITSARLQTSLRDAIRARNDDVPLGRRMANLQRPFCVSAVLKELLKREGRHLLDIIATGGETTGGGEEDEPEAVNTVMCLDLVTNRYTALAPMITARVDHATAVLNGKLFVIGGSNNEGALSSVECLDLQTGQWSEVTSMITPRWNHSAVVLGGKLFVAGGSPSSTVGTSVESFDPATNQWTAVAPMNTTRSNHGLVSAQGKLFAIGGYNLKNRHLVSVEYFDPSACVWSNIAALRNARSSPAVAVVGDKLYAIGGSSSKGQCVNSVECLDLSVANSQWIPIVPMTTSGAGIGAVGSAVVTSGEKIYVVGGSSRSIECFDPTDGPAGQWTAMSATSEFRASAKLTAC